MYDIVFLGHYTKDTIVSASGTRIVDGGAVFYGANVAARMGLKTAVITRLSREDFRVVQEVEELGVRVFAKETPKSTCLRLEYPSSNVDERVIRVISNAGPFKPEEVEYIETRAVVIGGSMRGEISLEVMEELAQKTNRIAADAQSFVRIDRKGTLVPTEWPEKQAVLALLHVLKADAVEAELLTGSADIRAAAKILWKRSCSPVPPISGRRPKYCTNSAPGRLCSRTVMGYWSMMGIDSTRRAFSPKNSWDEAVAGIRASLRIWPAG
jgi:sugar/nucleoside kinase (ribokinase family)